jgi:hypothetical protein
MRPFSHTRGFGNRHNWRILDSENPHALLEHVLDSPDFKVWCGVTPDRIVRPFFHKNPIMSAVYLDMLENFVFPQIVAEVHGLIFQQDGAPAHFGATGSTALDKRFPGRWIGRGGPISWPPLGPYLTNMDFLFGGGVYQRHRVQHEAR